MCALFSPLTYAQEQGTTKRTFDNYDVAPAKTVQEEKASEKPKEQVAGKSTEAAKDNSSSKEKIAEKPAEKATSSKLDTIIDKSVKNKSAKSKSAVIRTIAPKRKGEGYWQQEEKAATATAEPVAAPPPPKIYSEVRSSISENGRLMLTSDTIVVKPAMATKIVPVATLAESTGDQELDQIIQNAAQKNKIDPRLILEVIRQESGFRSGAISPKGASGLMQLIPATARRFGVVNIFDRGQNVHAGATYLKLLLDMFNGDLDLALAGYNAGENAVIRYNYSIPPYRETRDYVRSITTRYRSRYHQVATAEVKEIQIVHQVPLTTFASENGRVILSNNY